jgi:acyl dehydratase
MTELDAIPALGPLFAKAVLARKHSVGAPSAARLTVSDQPIDPARLVSYQQLCGFRVSDVLPPTYLHLMSFPLSVARMVDKDFPFPLLGLVHVDNEISQLRPVIADERVRVSAWAENLRPHASGQQIDLRSEARVGDELVWQETSTYLHRERTGQKPVKQQSEPPSGSVIRWQAESDTGRRYAAVSGDRNPIHLYNLSAKAFGFPGAIAHGMWLKARTLAAFEGRLPAAFTVRVAFKTPVFLPSKVELRASHAEVEWLLDVRNARSGKPHLTGVIS